MVTLMDVAKLAGVSRATASNVLNGRGNVSSAKIIAVQNAAAQLGYTVNLRAKTLREGRTRTLAVMLPNLFDRQYADFYTSFQHYAKQHDYGVTLYLSDDNPQHELEQLQDIRAALPAGVTAFTLYDGGEDVYARAGFAPEEILYVGHRPNSKCSSIGFDDRECGRELGRKARAYRNVAFVSENLRLSAQAECFAGFMEEVTRNPECHVTRMEQAGPYRAEAIAMNLFSADPQPEAVFVTNDGMASALRGVARSFFGRDVPICALSPLSTFPRYDYDQYELNYRLLGKEAAQMLIGMIEGALEPGCARQLSNYGFRSWAAPRGVGERGCLRIMTLDSPTAHNMESMARLYTRSSGVDVKVSIFAYDEVHDLLSRLDESCGFDVIRLDATWLAWFGKRIYAPLDELCPDIRAQQDSFLPGILPFYGQFSGHLYALPETPSSQMLFYRRDLFENPALRRLYKETCRAELRPPETFEEYNRIARFFSRSRNPDAPVRYGSTLTLGNTGVAATEFLTRYFSLNPTLFDQEDRILLESGEALEALRLLIEVSDYAPEAPSHWWRDTARLFARGDVAMTVLFSNYASEMLGRESRVNTDIGYAMVPGGNPLLGGGSIGVCRYSRNQRDAANFIRWYCSEEVSSAMSMLGSVAPCRKAYENHQVIDTYPWLAMSEECFAASHIRRWPRRMADGFDERGFLNILGTSVLRAIRGELSPEDALSIAQERYIHELDGR